MRKKVYYENYSNCLIQYANVVGNMQNLYENYVCGFLGVEHRDPASTYDFRCCIPSSKNIFSEPLVVCKNHLGVVRSLAFSRPEHDVKRLNYFF